MRMAALIIATALVEMGTDVSVMPAPESPPPHRALSMIWPPYSRKSASKLRSPGSTHRTCEYPTRMICELGHFVWKVLTAVATAAVPCFAESAYDTLPHEDCPPQAGYTMASEVAPECLAIIMFTNVPADPNPAEAVVSRAPKMWMSGHESPFASRALDRSMRSLVVDFIVVYLRGKTGGCNCI